jgi:hypothetical protein
LLFTPIRVTWPAQLIFLDLIILIILGEEYKSRSSTLAHNTENFSVSLCYGRTPDKFERLWEEVVAKSKKDEALTVVEAYRVVRRRGSHIV